MKKVISILLVLTMVFSLAACGSKTKKEDDKTKDTASTETSDDQGDSTAEPTEAAEVSNDPKVRYDLSEPVELVFYLVGDPGKDYEAVVTELNKYLSEKINTTIDFRFTTWTDWNQKYNLVLSSGEQCDLMYAADWTSYFTLAQTGAFYELDDMLGEYAPNLAGLISQNVYDMCKVDGKLYCIPADQTTYAASGIRYREDLRKKYNLPVPDSIENFEAYIKGIQDNEPDQGLLSPITIANNYMHAFYMDMIFGLKYSWGKQNYGLVSDYNNNPAEMVDYWRSDDFREDMKLLKKWADMGFWSRSSLANTQEEDFDEGLIVASVANMNQDKWIGSYNVAKEKHPDWEVGYVTYGLVNGVLNPASPLQNATVIPHNSKNPERALIALDFLMTDETANDLVQYGIQGKHWNLLEGQYYEEIKDSGFSYENMNTWNLRNHNFKKEMKPSDDTAYKDMIDSYEAATASSKWKGIDPAVGFIEDYSSYEIERASLNTVISQYLTPIQAGLVDDVDASIDEFLKKADEAGLSMIQEKYKEQWAKHCEEHGYK
jgi:putative aldouronate transport system substrate-binding protein